jgi:Rha family phage regulatory protein
MRKIARHWTEILEEREEISYQERLDMKIAEEKEKAILQPKASEIKLPKISKMMIGNNECFATTSLAVAEFTGKEHRSVLRDIRNLISKYGEGDFRLHTSVQSNDFNDLCSPLVYEESTYKDSNGISRVMFLLDEEFTTMLIMGFGTERSLLWKRAYIREFKRMREAEIELTNKLEVAKEAIITLATMMTRERGDFMAELHKLQCSFLSSIVSAQCYPAVNFAYTKAINIAVMGEHRKGIRSNITPEQGAMYMKVMICALSHMIKNRLTLHEIDWNTTLELTA